MIKLIKRLLLCFLIIISSLMAVSCFKKADTQNDVLTQTAAAEDKIPVTVLVKYAFTINNFEKEIEKKFPNLDLIQVGNYTSDMGKDEYAARLEHDDLTDVVMTWPLEVGEEYWDDRLIDLSSLPLSGKYNTNMLDTISKDGKLYYLPGPSQIRGILYNKTLFKEMGWDVPKDFEGFLALCDQIEKSGIRSLQLGLKNEEVFDTAFTGFGYANSFSKPEDAQWIDNYNNGKGSFGDHFIPALNTYKTLIDRGILKKEDLNIDYSDREKMFFTRKCAMIEDSVLMARMGNNTTGTNDEFGLMPFLNPAPDSDWARLYPVCYIGLNKNLESSKNKEKYDLIMELLEYISTPEGQTLLASDTGGMLSSLNGTKPPNVPEIDALFSTLTHGRYAVFTELQNVQSALREGLAGMLQGKLTTADVIKMVDQENSSPPQKPLPAVFGHASDDFTLMETGNFITDAMRSKSGCDLALFLDNGKDGKYNGKGVSGKFYKGDVTSIDTKRVLPDLKYGEKGVMCKISLTGEDLIKTLEYAIPVDNNRTGWFYYFSGLKMEFAPAAEPGKRIKKITTEDGRAIDPKQVYSVAIMDDSVPKDLMQSHEETDLKIADLLEQTITEKKTISPSNDNRFIISNP